MVEHCPQTSSCVRTEGGEWRFRLAVFACILTTLVMGGCATAPTRMSSWFDPGWSPATLAEANTARARLLANPRYIAEPAEPISLGACGMPAPIVLRGLRTSPPVQLSPPATIARPTAETFDYWFETVVQPAAWRTLGSPVTKVLVGASYSCRNRNNAWFGRLSSHAWGAAIDVTGFVTAHGDKITLREYWRRPGPASTFLRRVHQGACGPFGVVLGPDHDALHSTHFHLEVRRSEKPFCR